MHRKVIEIFFCFLSWQALMKQLVCHIYVNWIWEREVRGMAINVVFAVWISLIRMMGCDIDDGT